MIKRIVAISLVLIFVFSLGACKEREDGAEEAAKELMAAIFEGDIDGYVKTIPDLYLDALIENGDLDVRPGESKRDAAKRALSSSMGEEFIEVARDYDIKTSEISGKGLNDYMDEVAPMFIQAGILSQSNLAKIEDVVYVGISGRVTDSDGNVQEFSAEDGMSIPCIKIDGKWYADSIYIFLRAFSQAARPNINLDVIQ